MRIVLAAAPGRRMHLYATLALTLVGAIAELVTIGAVFPLLAVAASPGSRAVIPALGRILQTLGNALQVNAVLAASILLAVSAAGATLIRLLLTWVSQQLIFGLQRDLIMVIYGRALRQPYSWYVRQNSSVLMSGVEKVRIVTSGIFGPFVTAASSAILALFITAFLIAIDPVAALVSLVSIGIIYLIISLSAKNPAISVSAGLAESHTARIRTLQETLGGIRDIILDQSQPLFESKMISIEEWARRCLIRANFLNLAPRLVVEGAAIILVAMMAAWFSLQPGGVLGAIPILGALALGAQRLLPMVQSIYLGWAGYSIYAGSLEDVINLLEAPVEQADERNTILPVQGFEESIVLRDVCFSYTEGRAAISRVNMSITKGERIGLIGKTGSGKSTLVDILMGLLQPTAGALEIDGKVIDYSSVANWKAQIAHVPQQIFLIDDTIAANIAFGSGHSDSASARLTAAAERAGLLEFIGTLPSGLSTKVGERGVRLSGGQRQRIGIARALYKQATVLILDEATSSLDDATEAAVMDSVARLDRDVTIVMIAHRVSTLATCDRIYRLDKSGIIQQGSYSHIVGKAAAMPGLQGSET